MPTHLIDALARTSNDKAVDKLIVLRTVEKLGKKSEVSSTRLHKILFLIERQTLANRVNAPHYTFVKLDFGPFSKGLANDITEMLEAGLLTVDETGYRLTEKARNVLNKLEPVFERNRMITEVIDEKVQNYGGLPLRELLDYVYSIPRPLKGEKIPISELPRRSVLLKPHELEENLNIAGEEMVWLRVLLDPDVEEWEEVTVEGIKVLLVRYRDDELITALAPSLPGLLSQGWNREEAISNAAEAVKLYMATARAQ